LPAMVRRKASSCCAKCATGRPCASQRVGQSVSADASAAIGPILSGLGVSETDIQGAIQGYTNLDQGATSSILGILDGGPVDAASLSPVIALGMSAIPGIGPAAVAAVSVALPVLDMIAGLFSSPAPKCAWSKNWACFQGGPNGARPWGPTDAEEWQSFDTLKATDYELVLQAFPWYWVLECELGQIDPSTTDPVEEFRYAFAAAWKANAEYWINGYQGVDDKALLRIVADAWNRAHASTSTATFSAASPGGSPAGPFPGFQAWQGCPPSPYGGPAAFIETILSGATADIGTTGTRGAPVTINTGARVVTPTYVPSALRHGLYASEGISAVSQNMNGAIIRAASLPSSPVSRAAQGFIESVKAAAPVDAQANQILSELGSAQASLMREPHFWIAYYRIPVTIRKDPLARLKTASRGKVQAVAGMVSERAAHAWAERTRGLVDG
jgi:hypothetical protein